MESFQLKGRLGLVAVVASFCVGVSWAGSGDTPYAGAVDGTVDGATGPAIPGVVDIQSVIPDAQVRLAYSTPNNFMGRDVYGDLEVCYLQNDAAQMLKAARSHLMGIRPDLRLHIYDCLRPRSVQLTMWQVVKGTPAQNYVANPHTKTGSIHNYGCAVDLTLASAAGVPLDMGTAFDHFGSKAQPRKEVSLLGGGDLTHRQVANRLLLRQVMVDAGFYPISSEWWHFNCATPELTRARYTLVE